MGTKINTGAWDLDPGQNNLGLPSKSDFLLFFISNDSYVVRGLFCIIVS